LACAICEIRKEKRFCPAVHGRICPNCCGTEREVSLDCPGDCVYLLQARRNQRPGEISDDDQPEVVRTMRITGDMLVRHKTLFANLMGALTICSRRDRSLHDRDLIAGLSALAQGYEVRAKSGLLYQPATANPVQQHISDELQKAIVDYEKIARQQTGYSSVRDSDVLPMIVVVLRVALSHTSGRPLARGFMDFLAEEFPEKKSVLTGAEASGSTLIMP
jgi:hypothetical protein